MTPRIPRNDADLDRLLRASILHFANAKALDADVGARLDEVAVGNVVARHAIAIGCSDSNRTAAIAYGIRAGHDTLSAIRAGKARAEQLRARERTSTTEPSIA